MCWTWILTVVSAMSRARAISLLLAPRAMCARISLLARRQAVDAGRRRRGGRRRSPLAAQRLEGADQLARHLGADDRLACHRAQRWREASSVAVDRLQQVAARTAAQRGGQVALVLAHGEHQHPGLRRHFAQAGQCIDAVHAGQVVVEQDHVGLQSRRRGAALRRRRRPRRPPRSGHRRPAARSGRAGTGCGRRPPARGSACAVMPPSVAVRQASARRSVPEPGTDSHLHRRRRCAAPVRA